MSFTKYIRDRIAGICIAAATWSVIIFFLICFDTGIELVLFLSVIYMIGMTSMLIWDYFRKRSFYKTLCEGIEQLDKKYLISEIAKEPDFLEVKIVYDVLCESGKSMNDNISTYRNSSSEFREYIELWVHEAKLPVSSLLLMSRNDGENGNKYVEQLRRLDGCIESVLYYSRSESSDKDYIIKSVKISDVFRNSAVKNCDELLNRGIGIVTEGLDINVMTDAKWLEFVINQLMSNSMKYISELREPEIRVYTEESDDTVQLHFRDNGEGISEADLPYIFDKSYTGENGHNHSRSTGMGLYIVKNLCRRLGHGIRAESEKGRYTDIILTFGKNDLLKP